MAIINNYKFINPKLKISKIDYWDLQLIPNNTFGQEWDGTSNKNECLISYIDINDNECIENNKLYSKKEFIWNNSINNGCELNDIGLTGIDNGLILFEKDKISNQEFYNILTKSVLHIPANDKRLFLSPVSGNTMLYTYPYEIVTDNNRYISLKGGFFQGFFKLYGFEYQTLPSAIKDSWTLEFTLRKKNYNVSNNILNNTHPENKGIFFYIGTRCENKFWHLYNIEPINFPINCKYSYFNDSYINDDNFFNNKSNVINFNYFKEGINNNCETYLSDENYFAPEIDLENTNIETSEGHKPNKTGYYEFNTDNKFLLFNRTPTGYTTDNWVDGNSITFTGITPSKLDNYFLLFNRTPSGYTTDNIIDYISENENHYNLINDIIYNAFALKINEDNSIGYKYLIQDCNNYKNYTIIEENSKPNIILIDKWYNISVKFKILDDSSLNKERKMRVYIYVNGYLIFISKELPEFKFKQLNDTFDKQETIPYNISLGGGTQGLCDSIWKNYYEIPKYILPLEENFAGTFIGDLKSFKFYNCSLNYNEIQNNFIYELNKDKV